MIKFMELTIKAIQDINNNYNSTHHGCDGAQLGVVLSEMKQEVKEIKLYLETKDNEAMN